MENMHHTFLKPTETFFKRLKFYDFANTFQFFALVIYCLEGGLICVESKIMYYVNIACNIW